MNQHFLIVGRGLAGSLLAQTLIEHEQTVTIVDNNNANAASRIAAGIINPIIGQRMVLASDVDPCLGVALKRYQQLTSLFDQSFYFPKSLLRLFKDKRDKDRYRNRKLDGAYKAFLGDEFEKGHSGEPLNDELGGYVQHHSGYLAITSLLDRLKEYFVEHANLVEAQFNYDDLQFIGDEINWKGMQFHHVIFCEGASAVNNPWFRWLPFQLSKGELITIQSEDPLPDSIINKNHWLLPQNINTAKLGATYAWEWDDDEPSVAEKEKLLASCREMLAHSQRITVKNHLSGIRPTTKDKRPFIGTHPRYNNLHCFNGFGSKGGMLIPFYVSHLVEHLLFNRPLNCDVDIARFLKANSMLVLARQFLSENISSGDVVIDATLGNGHDAELMARCVGDKGQVIGFDVQPQAIDNTERRLKQAKLLHRVTLIQDSHIHLKQAIPDGRQGIISLVVFNLGFLPGSDKSCTTHSETTIIALTEALSLLKRNGSVVIVSYPGHDCGKNETEAVRKWLNELDKTVFNCEMVDDQQNFDAPSLYIITKT